MNSVSQWLVFVSYAHADRQFLDEELVPFLKQLELGGQITFWEDSQIGTGETWYTEIADRLDNAKVAILLITPPFLGSKFCQLEEIPVLLQRARQGKLMLLPLLVRPCYWENEPWLRRIQMLTGEGKALTEHDRPQRDRLLTEFAKQVLQAVNAPATVEQRRSPIDEPTATHDLHRMPQTGSLLFGRRDELKQLDDAWNGDTNLVAFTAGGGVGKSTLARVWAEMLAEDDWRGAERAYAWSFYSQGTGRITDAEGFINDALKWFGDDTPEVGSIWERAERLANCIRKRRTLLILDGVEPLQSGDEGVDKGCIRDPGLRTLLEELAKDNLGLCVVTTRERLADFKEYDAPVVLHQDLDQVSKLAGRALLRVDRIRGEDVELEATVEDLDGHALAVSLLSNLLTDDNLAPHISNAKHLPALSYPVEQDGHPRRVLDAWANRLGDSADLELLQIIGLFDRPAAEKAIQAVIDDDPLPGLNKHLQNTSLDDVLKRLRIAQLLARESTHEETVDAHPIVREHFGQRLEAQHPKSWREGHRRLYEFHKDLAEYQPDDLEGMQPLFAAVVHGCAAGLYQEVCYDLYLHRINRGGVHLAKKLGAMTAALSCVSQFFVVRWTRTVSTLPSFAQSLVFNNSGFLLRVLGRLREATGPMEEALRLSVAVAQWKEASIGAGNLSELYLAFGDLSQAEARAREAVDYADRSGDAYQHASMMTTQADAQHQLGQTSDARALFAEAERMQAEKYPNMPVLYSIQGYRYCELLLAEGEVDEVSRRVEQSLEVATQNKWLLDIALDHLSLGRAYMATSPPDPTKADEHLQAAVDGLRTSGNTDDLPRGLLARAEFHRSQDNLDSAQRDLDEVRTIVRRTSMRLFEADLELEQTRWHLAKKDRDSTRESLDKAKKLVKSMNYGRRRPEVETLEAELGS